jgi:hypothetical protein
MDDILEIFNMPSEDDAILAPVFETDGLKTILMLLSCSNPPK